MEKLTLAKPFEANPTENPNGAHLERVSDRNWRMRSTVRSRMRTVDLHLGENLCVVRHSFNDGLKFDGAVYHFTGHDCMSMGLEFAYDFVRRES